MKPLILLSLLLFSTISNAKQVVLNYNYGDSIIPIRNKKIKVFTHTGILLGEFEPTSTSRIIDLDIPSGFYFFEVTAFLKTYRRPFQYNSDGPDLQVLCFNERGSFFSQSPDIGKCKKGITFP